MVADLEVVEGLEGVESDRAEALEESRAEAMAPVA